MRKHLLVSIVMSMALCLTSAYLSPAAAFANDVDPPAMTSRGINTEGGLETFPRDNGVNGDASSVKLATRGYNLDDKESIVALVKAVSAQKSLKFGDSGSDTDHTSASAGNVQMNNDGSVTSVDSHGFSVSIDAKKVLKNGDLPQIVNGAAISTDKVNKVSAITSTSDGGLRAAVVLGSKDSPTEFSFPYQLPQDASLKLQDDGSVDVVASVSEEKAVPEEQEVYDKQVEEIVGSKVVDIESLTADQMDKLTSLPLPKTQLVTVQEKIAQIAAPWAVDAAGKTIPTHYELKNNQLFQIVETDANTVFPVTADPSWQWWGSAVLCAIEIATAVFVPIARLSKLLAKANSLISRSVRLKKAIDRLGGFKSFLLKVRTWIINKTKLSPADISALRSIANFGIGFILGLLGFGDCVTVVQGWR